ncbi:Gti1/Pac2 family-domain-containing protein [Podospora didyma]|uniref:Gti1/Pac2 family-domain-containing protein n=1 Tax=Podospora didyma TaxID=330526 RepID=A0AAE0NP80_9PEZI|nr:Gti1/Pac2 family-domain-containing protein [Podospora didyma]
METYNGQVRTPADAIKLFEACRLGLLPRVQRRLSEKERQSIRSGSVFVWDEREAGMRRWTDGKSWSASRVSGSFLTYREMEGKRGSGFGTTRRGAGKTPDSGRGSDEDQDDGEPDGYRYKADGLMKQSFSITTSTGQHLHLISYYSRGHTELPQPSTDPALRNIVPVKGMYPESSMTETPLPAMTRAPMQQSPYGQHQQHPHQVSPHPGFPPQYPQQPQPGFWPPSPMSTPPFNQSHYNTLPPYPQASLPPPQHHYAHAPPQPYQPSVPSSQYEQRSTLPPPQPSAPSHQQPPHHSPHMSQPVRMTPLDSPRAQHLQAQARDAAVLIDPRLAATAASAVSAVTNGTRNTSGPLPAPGQQTQSGVSADTPPPRTGSVSPSRSAHSEAAGGSGMGPSSNKAPSIPALLLHPTPTNSEPNSANPGTNSANSSPRAPPGVTASGQAGPGQQNRIGIEDARTLRQLDKKFCA